MQNATTTMLIVRDLALDLLRKASEPDTVREIATDILDLHENSQDGCDGHCVDCYGDGVCGIPQLLYRYPDTGVEFRLIRQPDGFLIRIIDGVGDAMIIPFKSMGVFASGNKTEQEML